MGFFHSVGQVVNNVVGDNISGNVKQLGGKVQDLSSNKVVNTAIPFTGLYTAQGRANLASTYGPYLSTLAGGVGGPVGTAAAGTIFNLAGSVPGVLPPAAPPAQASGDSGGGGSGYGYVQQAAAAAGVSTTTLAIAGGAALLLIIAVIAMRK